MLYEQSIDNDEPPSCYDKKWKNDLKNRITQHLGLENLETNIPFATTKYYFDLAEKVKEIRKCVIPSKDELIIYPYESDDPLHEDKQSPCPSIIHRYPDRVLFLVTNFCSSYCRYCTRSRKLEMPLSKSDINQGILYIRNNQEIRDVLISGGDPLTLSDNDLIYILSELRKIKHVEILRIGTKVPVVLPSRITNKLCNILKQFHPLYINIHFTHPAELQDETKNACIKLANVGIPLGSQTVLLKDVNDNINTMKNLMLGLLKIRVKPYYIYQLDRIFGSSHFHVPIEKGIEIIKGLQGYITGFGVPKYIIDSPEGGGKVEISPETFIISGKEIFLYNYKGNKFVYNDN